MVQADITQRVADAVITAPALHTADFAEVLIPDDQFQQLRSMILDDIERLGHPYHNREHTEGVEFRAAMLATSAGCTAEEIQLIRLAALFHDYGHAGYTYRQLVQGVERPDLSNEEYAAICADKMTESLLSADQRERLRQMILATSYGQKDSSTFPNIPGIDFYRDYGPSSKLDYLLAFADISEFVFGFDRWMSNGMKVMQECREDRPRSFDEYCERGIKHLRHVRGLIDKMESILPAETEAYIRSSLADTEVQLATCRSGTHAKSTHYRRIFADQVV